MWKKPNARGKIVKIKFHVIPHVGTPNHVLKQKSQSHLETFQVILLAVFHKWEYKLYV